jgi:gluconate 5-dehydrogenase
MPPPYDRLSGKVALVTGAGRGIGRAIAHAYAAEGADLVICGRGRADLDDAATEFVALGHDCLVESCDVTVPDDVDRLVAAAMARFGRIDILVNNAGSTVVGPSADMPMDDWRRIVEVNQNAVFLVSQRVGRVMLRQRAGAILNIASLTSYVAFPERAPYAATKAAILSITRTLAVEWAPHGIRVNAIAPGMVATDLQERLIREGKFDVAAVERRIPLGRRARPDEMAPAAVFLVSDEAAYITGTVLTVDGGYLANGFWL